MKLVILLTAATLLTGALTGCQTPRYQEFPQVKQGMEKDLVLEAVGNPRITRRWHNKDRWIYTYAQTPDGPQTREVHFENGKAVYVGMKVVPAITAEEQDRLNEERDLEEQRRIGQTRDGGYEVIGVVPGARYESVEGSNQ